MVTRNILGRREAKTALEGGQGSLVSRARLTSLSALRRRRTRSSYLGVRLERREILRDEV